MVFETLWKLVARHTRNTRALITSSEGVRAAAITRKYRPHNGNSNCNGREMKIGRRVSEQKAAG